MIFLLLNLAKEVTILLSAKKLLEKSGSLIKSLLPTPKMFIITDENVARIHLPKLEHVLTEAGINHQAIIVEPGESSKSFAVLEVLLEEVLDCKPERQTTLIALGGGVVGDLTGVSASLLLRGVNFIQIPTTLLAQVDSSVGGKTGINSKHGKNLVGSFYQPKLVLADLDLLDSLPEREFLSGYAEVVKYGLINDEKFFSWLVENEEKIKEHDTDTLKQCVITCCQAKADIVASDEREGGIRALLNLGHTFGHALEAETGYGEELLHGEAVAIGMVMAFELSSRLGHCSADEVDKVKNHFTAVGLPISMKDIRDSWDVDALLGHMQRDKKVSGGKMVFILVKGIGEAYIEKEVGEAELLELLKV